MEDPSLGPFDPAQVQIHDFNPGDLNPEGQPNYFMDGGVFWTRAVPKKSVEIAPGAGDASFVLSDFENLDWLTVVNALFRPEGFEPIPATSSVNIQWTGTGERVSVSNNDAGFGGQYENATASVQWSASNDEGYSFSTAGSSETIITHAFTAKIRNGVFNP